VCVSLAHCNHTQALTTSISSDHMKAWITAELLQALEECKGKVSLDLGKTFVDCEKARHLLKFKDQVKEGFVYFYNNGTLTRLDLFKGRYFKLEPLPNFSPPTLQIDGIRMHVLKGFKHVFEYGKRVAQLLNVKAGDNVLETCFGLGYVTRALLNHGATVTSIEREEGVIELGKYNPWTADVLNKIQLIVGKAEDVVPQLTQQFDKIVHDPPRFSHAPILYSRKFYKNLIRVSTSNTLLYHYVGYPLHYRRNFMKEVKKRLEDSGWRVIKEWKKGHALIAQRA